MGTRFRPLAFEQEARYADEDLEDSLVAAMRSGTMPLSTQAAPGHQGTEGPLLCLLLFLALPHACPVLFNPLSHLGGVHGGTVGGRVARKTFSLCWPLPGPSACSSVQNVDEHTYQLHFPTDVALKNRAGTVSHSLMFSQGTCQDKKKGSRRGLGL